VDFLSLPPCTAPYALGVSTVGWLAVLRGMIAYFLGATLCRRRLPLATTWGCEVPLEANRYSRPQAIDGCSGVIAMVKEERERLTSTWLERAESCVSANKK